MTVIRILSDYVLAHPEEFPREFEEAQSEQVNADNTEFKEYVLNALKNLKSKMKSLTIVVGNSNNYTGYSILSGKSEAVESGFGFMGIEGYKVLFKWLRYHNRYLYIDLRDLSIDFLDDTVISGTTGNPYKPDNTKVKNM
jgi:hypothetical protein